VNSWLGAFGIPVGYLLGSIPSGYWAGQWLKNIDIREYGSKSTGATNVLRVLGKGPAAAVFSADVFKGVLAVLSAQFLGQGSDLWIIAAGLMAILGHSKSIFLNFSGGKSVAVSVGLLLAMDWRVGLCALALWGVIVGLTRWVSLGSVLAAMAIAPMMYGFGNPPSYVIFGAVGGLYVIIRHKANMQRLLKGTEPRIGEKVEV
jgi:acyl phosphate:glycerol-3-phosphate acyltransferase